MNNLKILIIVCTIGVFGLWTHPNWKKVQNLKSEKGIQEKTLEVQQKKVEKIKEQLSANNDKKPSHKKIPQKKEQEGLIRDLLKISQKTGFVFDGISFSQGLNADIEATDIIMNLSVSGRKSQLFAFLKSLEVNQRFLLLENFQVNFEDKNKVSIAKLSLSLHAFSQN